MFCVLNWALGVGFRFTDHLLCLAKRSYSVVGSTAISGLLRLTRRIHICSNFPNLLQDRRSLGLDPLPTGYSQNRLQYRLTEPWWWKSVNTMRDAVIICSRWYQSRLPSQAIWMWPRQLNCVLQVNTVRYFRHVEPFFEHFLFNSKISSSQTLPSADYKQRPEAGRQSIRIAPQERQRGINRLAFVLRTVHWLSDK